MHVMFHVCVTQRPSTCFSDHRSKSNIVTVIIYFIRHYRTGVIQIHRYLQLARDINTTVLQKLKLYFPFKYNFDSLPVFCLPACSMANFDISDKICVNPSICNEEVYTLECLCCLSGVCDRGMKSFLIADEKMELYSTDQVDRRYSYISTVDCTTYEQRHQVL